MRITVNPEAQASGDFGHVASGIYTLRVRSADVKQKAGSEFGYIKWTLELADPNVECANNEEGKTPKKAGNIFENTTLKPDAQFRLRDLCDAMGLTWGDFDTDNCIGIEFQAHLKIKEYNGILSNEISKFIPAN